MKRAAHMHWRHLHEGGALFMRAALFMGDLAAQPNRSQTAPWRSGSESVAGLCSRWFDPGMQNATFWVHFRCSAKELAPFPMFGHTFDQSTNVL